MHPKFQTGCQFNRIDKGSKIDCLILDKIWANNVQMVNALYKCHRRLMVGSGYENFKY